MNYELSEVEELSEEETEEPASAPPAAMAPEIALPKEEVARWKKNAKAKVLRDKIRDQALAAKSHGGSSAQTMTTTKADLESMVTRPVLEAIVQLRKESAENREAVFEEKPAGRTEELVRDWEGKIRVLEGQPSRRESAS